MRKRGSISGAEALFVSAFMYALTGILAREVSSMWSDKAQVAVRFAIVLLLLAAYSFIRKKKLFVPKANLPLTLGLGSAFAVMVLFFTSAIQKTTVANVLFVFYATNMISSFWLGTILLKESVSRDKLWAMAFALAGLALYSGAIVGGSKGIIFSIAAGLCGGGVNLISKLLKGVSHSSILVTQYAIAVIFTVPLMLLSGDEMLRTASLHGTLLTILFAGVIIAGSSLLLYGFQHFDVNVGTVIMSTELIFAAIMAYFLFSEVPKTNELIGGVVIFAGSIIGSGIFSPDKKPPKPIAQPD